MRRLVIFTTSWEREPWNGKVSGSIGSLSKCPNVKFYESIAVEPGSYQFRQIQAPSSLTRVHRIDFSENNFQIVFLQQGLNSQQNSERINRVLTELGNNVEVYIALHHTGGLLDESKPLQGPVKAVNVFQHEAKDDLVYEALVSLINSVLKFWCKVEITGVEVTDVRSSVLKLCDAITKNVVRRISRLNHRVIAHIMDPVRIDLEVLKGSNFTLSAWEKAVNAYSGGKALGVLGELKRAIYKQDGGTAQQPDTLEKIIDDGLEILGKTSGTTAVTALRLEALWILVRALLPKEDGQGIDQLRSDARNLDNTLPQKREYVKEVTEFRSLYEEMKKVLEAFEAKDISICKHNADKLLDWCSKMYDLLTRISEVLPT